MLWHVLKIMLISGLCCYKKNDMRQSGVCTPLSVVWPLKRKKLNSVDGSSG